MAEWWWIFAALVAIVLAAVLLAWSPLLVAIRDARLTDARRGFHLYRERLEMKFIRLAAAHAKPEGPRWADCEFDNDVAYVRSRATRELAAFVGLTVALEDHEALSPSPGGRHFHSGTAVFRFHHGHWDTEGQALLNLSPAEAVRFYRNEMEVVAQELAR